MKITREQILNIIKEEYASAMTNETEFRGAGTVHSDGLMDMIRDFLTKELSGWHDVAKATLHKEIAENGFDISEIVMTALGGEVKEEITLSEIGAARSPEEVFASADESLNQAHKDLQMLVAHLKNGGFDTRPTEDVIRSVERDIIHLNELPKEDVEKLGSLKGPLKRGTRD